ncbi:MAG: hypothetical protein A2885_05505 [Sphingopyxis sp. RIFCSPHIGHO2_01_FULL_65_24]|nr:MAG: hypothetical protein A2885_05505 [Sphingopyxis sp. RIFCSPHIGHO2_01_FULL_65_24]
MEVVRVSQTARKAGRFDRSAFLLSNFCSHVRAMTVAAMFSLARVVKIRRLEVFQITGTRFFSALRSQGSRYTSCATVLRVSEMILALQK